MCSALKLGEPPIICDRLHYVVTRAGYRTTFLRVRSVVSSSRHHARPSASGKVTWHDWKAAFGRFPPVAAPRVHCCAVYRTEMDAPSAWSASGQELIEIGRELLVGERTGHAHPVELAVRRPTDDERGCCVDYEGRRFSGIAGDRAFVPVL